MSVINYDGKVFKLVSSDGPGDVDSQTVFFYHQKDDYLWGHYEGGNVIAGVLIGRVLSDHSLAFTYDHYDIRGILKRGICRSYPEWVQNHLYMKEQWRWTEGLQGEGSSILVEINQK